MKNKIVYKVTDTSFGSYCTHGQCRVFYELKKKTIPKAGKLFAFKTLKAAKAFSTYPIFRCSAKPAEDQKFVGSTSSGSLVVVEKAWNDPTCPIENLPEGTILCDWIKPLERVQ